MITSIGAASSQSFYLFFHFKSFLITFHWLEKSLDRKPVPIELIISLFTWSKQTCFFGGPAFFQQIRAFWTLFKLLWLAGLKPAFQKSHFCFGHVNRLRVNRL